MPTDPIIPWGGGAVGVVHMVTVPHAAVSADLQDTVPVLDQSFSVPLYPVAVVRYHAVSGCHLNPAISIAMFLDKKITSKDLLGYIVAQVIGAIIVGAIVLHLFSVHMGIDFGDIIEYGKWGANTLDGVDGSILAGLITETVLTFIIVLVVFGATAKNGMEKFAGFFIGLALAMVHFVGIALTGTSVSPARSIGLAIFQPEALGDLWVSSLHLSSVESSLGSFGRKSFVTTSEIIKIISAGSPADIFLMISGSIGFRRSVSIM